jgi:hypothetical protein
MQYGVPPLHIQEQSVGTAPSAQIIRPIEEDSAGPEAYDPRYPPNSRYGAAGPSRETASFPNRQGWDQNDIDEKPGEVEIMRQIFSVM